MWFFSVLLFQGKWSRESIQVSWHIAHIEACTPSSSRLRVSVSELFVIDCSECKLVVVVHAM